MESKMMGRACSKVLMTLGLAVVVVWWATVSAQELPDGGQAEINLRRSAQSRSYQGREVEGEERQIARGDTLWRILVRDKGLPGQNFRSYLVVIRGLNPQIRDPEVLQVGDKIFIPLRPDQIAGGRPTAGTNVDRSNSRRGGTTNYRVKAGEHLYQILRDQLKLTDDRKVAQYHALVRDLNPERNSWDTLVEGEVIRLPSTEQASQMTEASMAKLAPSGTSTAKEKRGALTSRTGGKGKTDAGQVATSPAVAPRHTLESATPENHPTRDPRLGTGTKGDEDGGSQATVVPAEKSQRSSGSRPTVETQPAAPAADLRKAMQAPAKEQMALFAKLAAAVGGELQDSGEDVIPIKDGKISFDKASYPVVYSAALRQKVVLDPDGQIPVSLRSQLAEPSIGTPIVSMANGLSIREAVGQLLAGLGYQSLPANRPVTIQEEGVSYEAKGAWMALAPEQSNKTQEIYVINLTDAAGEIPDYLKTQLRKNGLYLKDVLLPGSASRPGQQNKSELNVVTPQVKSWPRDKREMVDALLFSYGVPFGVAETLSVQLRNGLRIDTRSDRIFELAGKKTALFFQRPDPEIVKALQERQGIRVVDLDLVHLSSRDVIGRVLHLLGDQTAYAEHRFAAANGPAKDRLTVTAWGFHLPQRSMFVTDRRIPAGLHRFFFEKGLEIVYFQ